MSNDDESAEQPSSDFKTDTDEPDETSDSSGEDDEYTAEFALKTPAELHTVEYRVFKINNVSFDERDLPLLQAMASGRTDSLDVIDPTQDQRERMKEAGIIKPQKTFAPSENWAEQGKDVLRSLRSAMMKKPEDESNRLLYLLIVAVFLLGLVAALLVPSLSTL